MSVPNSNEPGRMGVKDVAGLMCCIFSACAAVLGYKILGTAWNLGLALLGSVGLWLLWGAQRERQSAIWSMDAAGEGDAADYGSGTLGDDQAAAKSSSPLTSCR